MDIYVCERHVLAKDTLKKNCAHKPGHFAIDVLYLYKFVHTYNYIIIIRFIPNICQINWMKILIESLFDAVMQSWINSWLFWLLVKLV